MIIVDFRFIGPQPQRLRTHVDFREIRRHTIVLYSFFLCLKIWLLDSWKIVLINEL